MLMLLKTSEPSGTSQSICTRTIRNWKTSPAICTGTSTGICTGAPQNLTRYLHRNRPEPHKLPAPELSGTVPSTCTGTLRNFTGYLDVPEPSRTSPGICTGGNLSKYLHLNPPEPHLVSTPEAPPELQQVSGPEPSETSPGICSGTLRNPPEPSGTLRNPPEPSGTLRNLAQNLVLRLHRIAPELIWAKDPIAKFCCCGKLGDTANAQCWPGAWKDSLRPPTFFVSPPNIPSWRIASFKPPFKPPCKPHIRVA